MTVSNITSPIASLKILSPKTIENRLFSTSNYLNTAITATVSVVDINDPKSHESFIENSYDNPNLPHVKNIILEKNIDIKVPKMAYINIEPIFLKKYFFCMLYPLSNIIGGNKIIIKIWENYDEICSIVDLMLIL